MAFFESAALAGISADEFWNNTPKINDLIIKAFWKRHNLKHNELAWTAWHIAALGRTKKLPKLKSLLVSIDPKPVEPQTMEDQIRMVEFINAALGGKDLRKK